MSMRKSNWSDFESALAMSDRESVRRLLESATMKARAVISEMKTSEESKGTIVAAAETEMSRTEKC